MRAPGRRSSRRRGKKKITSPGARSASASSAAASGGTANNPWPIRASNSVKYSSPKFAGFTFGALWSPGSSGGAGSVTAEPTTTTPKNGKYWDANVLWSQGQFGAGFALGRATTETATGSADPKRNQLTGKWDAGAFGVYAGYATDKRDAVGTFAKVDDRFFWVQPVFRFGGSNEAFGLFGKAKDKTVADNNTTWWGVGARHRMSKRTWAYAVYGKAKNDTFATRTYPVRGRPCDGGTEPDCASGRRGNHVLRPASFVSRRAPRAPVFFCLGAWFSTDGRRARRRALRSSPAR